jgi:hypothetical protein
MEEEELFAWARREIRCGESELGRSRGIVVKGKDPRDYSKSAGQSYTKPPGDLALHGCAPSQSEGLRIHRPPMRPGWAWRIGSRRRSPKPEPKQIASFERWLGQRQTCGSCLRGPSARLWIFWETKGDLRGGLGRRGVKKKQPATRDVRFAMERLPNGRSPSNWCCVACSGETR